MKLYIIAPIEIDEDDFGAYPQRIRNISDPVERGVAMVGHDLEFNGVSETLGMWEDYADATYNPYVVVTMENNNASK